MATGRIHSVESFGALDGPGIRFVLFMQGCPLRCLYCHNPDTWSLKEGIERTTEDVLAEILTYHSFISGVTLSGGEPLMQPVFAAELLSLCKQNGLHTAIDTAGSIPLAGCKQAVDAADLLLLDIKALDPSLCKTITGRDNRYSLELLRYCEQQQKPVYLRHVLLPGYTLEKDRLTALADYLKDYRCIEKVELLPFHKLGEYKWRELNLDYRLYQTNPPEQEQMEAAREIFLSCGFCL